VPDRVCASERRGPAARTLTAVQELEFMVEPFVEGRPGPHVTAAVDAARAAGGEVEFGPFGSTCRADSASMPDILAAITRAAFANGATHVSMHVVKLTERDQA